MSCWIQGSDREQAEERASDLVHEYGWSVEALEEGAIVTSADYQDGDEDHEFFEQALVEGEVLVFNTWPRTEDDETE